MIRSCSVVIDPLRVFAVGTTDGAVTVEKRFVIAVPFGAIVASHPVMVIAPEPGLVAMPTRQSGVMTPLTLSEATTVLMVPERRNTPTPPWNAVMIALGNSTNGASTGRKSLIALSVGLSMK